MDNAVAAATGFMFSLALPVLLIQKLVKKILVYIKKA